MGISSTSRITGMASGLDTDRLVEEMLSASKARINKARQQKIALEWKQEIYKSVTSRLFDFQKKYFGASGGLSSSLKTMGASYSSPYVSVTPTANAAKGRIVIQDIVSLAEPAKLTGGRAAVDPVLTVSEENLASLAGKSLVFTLDGVSKTVSIPSEQLQTVEDVQSTLSALVSGAFGQGRVVVTAQGTCLTFRAENSTLSVRLPDDPEQSPAGILDFGGYTANRPDLSLPLGAARLGTPPFSEEDAAVSFQINGVSFSFDKEATLGHIMNTVSQSDAGVTMAYSSLTGQFSLTARDTGAGSSVSVFDTEGSLMTSLFGGGTLQAGNDAEIRLATPTGDITVTRSSNTFDLDGTIVKLLGKADGAAAENITIDIDHNGEQFVDTVSAFLADYNELLGAVTKLTWEKANKGYLPLTDDDRKQLSDDEARLWTEKAKSGLLNSDPYLSALESELRSCFYTAVGGLGGLDQIGITSGSYREKGHLYLDKNKLLEAFGRDAAGTIALLTQESPIRHSLYAAPEQQQTRFSENGLLSRMSDLLTKNLSNIGRKGSLILLVGSPNSTYDSETDYAKRIQGMNDKISRLEVKLEAEESRYWKQFTAMESALARLNSQSSYIANLFGNNSNNQ